ncbi:MAG: ATP-binding protein [Bryobacteraceae bacterium]
MTFGSVPPPDVLQQIERILVHPLFQKSHRLSDFLRYAVEKTLAGEAGQLKEFVIGAEVFERGAGFDPQMDNVVRVNANRLRSKLAEYYQHSGAADPILISIPRGGYVPYFSWAQPNDSPITRFQGPANADRTNPAVGRRLELERLRGAFATASGGTGILATVSGDAGIGKTTTVEQFLSEFDAIQGTVWIARGRCSERLAKMDAFVAVLDCLDDLVHNAPSEVWGLLRTVGPTWLAQLRPGQDRLDPILGKGDVISHERMRREFVNFLEALAAIRPAIVFLDDIHWADPSTCDLLAYLGSRMSGLRLLIVAAYRPGEALKDSQAFFSTLLAMRRRGSSTDLALPLLTKSDIEEYLTIRFPLNSFSAEFKAVIQERTEGNPLFMTDLLDYLVEGKVLTATNGTWSLVPDIGAVRGTTPFGARSVIRLKIEQLGEADRSILQCAAVQGVEFDSAVVSRALAIDPANLEERLQVLESVHRFVHLIDERAFPEGTLSARYQFLHVFYQNTLYADLTPTKRTRLCLGVANSLASLAAADTGGLASELAFLFEAGRDDDNASRYFQQAATQAAKVFAYTEAAVLCESGLKCLMRLPESTGRDARELTLSLIAGMAMMAALGYAAPQVEAVHRRSRQLCLSLNQERRLVQVLWALHTCHINAGELDSALEIAMEMRELASRLDSPAATIESLHALGTSLAFLGQLVEAREALEGIFKICPVEQFVPRHSVYLLDPCVTSLSMLARLLALLGHVDEAIEKAYLSVGVANRILHPPTLAYATFWVGWIRHQRGEHAEACVHLEAAMTLSDEHGLPLIREWGRVVRGSALTHLNRVEEGVAEMQSSLEAQTAMHCRLERPYCLTLLAEGLMIANRNHEALSLCDQAHAIALETQALGYEPEAHRVRALALLAIGREPAAAEQELEAALDLAQRTQSRLLELRAATTYFQLRRDAEARETLWRSVTGH